jgi:hypothetical protein
MKRVVRVLLFAASILVLAAVWSEFTVAGDEKKQSAAKSSTGVKPTVYPQLPFDLAKVVSIDSAKLSDEEKTLLSKNGFVVVGPRHGNMVRCYPTEGIPLVTIDSVLEVYLSDFEIAWGELENKQAERFAKFQTELWDALVSRFDQLPEGATRAAGQRLLGLVAVGRSLSDPMWKIPEALPKAVDAEALRIAIKGDLELVSAHQGQSESALWQRTIEWSIFRPVGAYAKNETARNYYRASQWWGRQGLRTAEREERLSVGILMWVLEDASPADPKAKDMFGFPDPDGRKGPLKSIEEIEWAYYPFFDNPEAISIQRLRYSQHDPNKEDRLRVPRDFGTDRFDAWIKGVFGEFDYPRSFRESDIRDATPERNNGQSFCLLPPRATRDSQIFDQVIDPHVPGRLLPTGLDVLAALGDARALELTLEREPTPKTRDALAKQLGKLRGKNEGHELTFPSCLTQMYTALAEPRLDYSAPLFARTSAYRDRCLTSSLAFWAGAREIYNVRVMSALGIGGGSEPSGIADPNLEGWQRLIELCHATSQAFSWSKVEFGPKAMSFALTYRRLAEMQLRGEELSRKDRGHFLHYFNKLSNAILRNESVPDDYDGKGWRIDRRVAVDFARSRMPDATRYAGKACCRIYAVVEYDGSLFLCQGGVFDYCEFDRPAGTSLSREEFAKLMDSPQAPEPPDWTRSFRVSK